MPKQKHAPLSENTNLEFHVDLCSERYKQMNQKLDNLRKQAEDQKVSNDKKFEKLFEKIDTIYIQIAESKSSQNKMLIAVLVATLTAVIGAFISQM
jgi:hypothetical protein|tara:strand:+ start:239 stop:526 length:288 start_codon:yes stop_codon:yes gene_type:complete